VRFTYQVPRINTTGYKLRHTGGVTDAGGIARLRIERIQQVGEVQVTAALDLGAEVHRLGAATGPNSRTVRAFQDILDGKKLSLLFRADTPARKIPTAVYVVQRDVQGNILPELLTAAAVHRVLSEKGFRVTLSPVPPGELQELTRREAVLRVADEAGGEEVRRVLYGTVGILDQDQVSGYHTARASVEVALVELDSGTVARSWRLIGSGTGKSSEEAVRSAFNQAGVSLGRLLARTMP
jgi:hypothetical protein